MTSISSPSAALVLFSAGQDSATCLAWALNRFARVETIGFDYGQRHAIELAQRPVVLDALRSLDPAWAQRLGRDVVVDMKGFGALAHSALTGAGEISAEKRGLPWTMWDWKAGFGYWDEATQKPLLRDALFGK